MANAPLFLSPDDHRADLIQVDRALDSMRDAGFDLTAAIGEPLDNSIEADATLMRVQPIFGRGKKTIDRIIIADNGVGIEPTQMHHVLSMGYSSRYGQRQGLGRFGVGLKLAGLSLGERIEIYSKRTGDPKIYYSYIDLQEIREGNQRFITTTEASDWPGEAVKLMTGRDRRPFSSGTVVIFGKIDRLASGGTYGTSLEQKISELRKFIARAYRTYIDTGRVIELDGKITTLHDPLFLRDNPRIISRYKPLDPRGELIEETDLEIDGHTVHVTVAIVPKEFRPWRRAGGEVDFKGQDISEFQINAENTAKISILRNGREIYYDIVPRLLEGGRSDKVLRYVAIEVSFPAELDEYFQVRNVKRGAEPVSKLRSQLREWLKAPVKQALRQVRALWEEEETKKRFENGEHSESMDTASRVMPALPNGPAGRGATPELEEMVVQQAAMDMGLDPDTDATKIAHLREQINSKPVTLLDAQWPGKEFLVIHHLNGKSVIKFNHRHAFFQKVYAPLKKVADEGAQGMEPEELSDLARRAEAAIDLLFMGYARAEGMYEDPEQFDNLRTYWGMFTEALLREEFKDQ
ncbi:Histidine kinase-, DNA gyrase B-, and HSP90-like ATPase [Streptoalloteichus tenebrarius]|uniref:Histidine kinase-, DNA gyrase B-, and HSP90-like ATPase n=1 Tax=Streptoalloteichus tenebrarius (strain ATCC 17920 / DSM 40477 / JCM 4838 / CBS 697.72 / NBRC 16177 / NCIMB 11028 / NRRL B-12390 / A12253. 1 / ISP 5477) TaxID=1933 RepID=A0ABT1I372_STRSD|nr:ATP-binding protein [Streptoalloteichus tenebrarius]MCP2262025.1 Histidine kinase-, DNA gyrase B-, and HSP90-like ATPase [Streptoalloteichus tenebrarius]